MHSYESITRSELVFSTQLIEHGQTFYQGNVAGVGPNYFDVLGVRPLLGRTFIPSDETADIKPVVASERLVKQLFPNGESPIGARISINLGARIIVGVISDAAALPNEGSSLWEVSPFVERGMYIRLMRLRDGASPADAERELAVISARIAGEAGEDPKANAFRFHQAADPEFQVRGFHYALVLAVFAVLLVACANVANIQLARGIGRRRELALRSALGATRQRIVRHLLGESLILGAVGLALGLVLTYWGSRALAATIPPTVGQFVIEPQFSWRVLVFALGATLFCVFVVGVAPAITVSRTNPNELLKSGAGTGATKRNRRLYAILVGAEIALALVLTSGATVLVRTWMLVNSMHYGFDPRPLAISYVNRRLEPGTKVKYSDILQSTAIRVAALKGVSDAATSMSMGVENDTISIEDAGRVREFPQPFYSAEVVSPTYLRTMGLPITKGRDFLDGERDHAVAIIDAHTAKVLFPNANPVGALIKLGDKRSNRPYVRVVGVVGELKDASWNALSNMKRLGRIYYLPGPTDEFTAPKTLVGVELIARSKENPEKLPLVLRREFATWSDVRIAQVTSMDDYLGLTRARDSERFVASLFSLFAALGVGLAAFGVYGVVAHSVAERRRELGVRVALGATGRDILHAVLRESAVVALAGAALGLLMTKYGVRLLGSMVREDDFFNAPLFAAVALLLVTISAMSAFIPALRATRIDPTESLRNE